MNTASKIGIGLGIGLIGFGLTWQIMQQIKLAKSYCYKIKGLIFKTTTAENITVEVTIAIKNKSDIALDVLGYNFDFYLNDRLVGVIESDQTQSVVANGVSEVKATISFNPTKLFDKNYALTLLSYLLTSKERIVTRTVGYVRAKHSFMFPIKVPLDIKMNLKEILADDPNAEQCNI